MKTLTAVLPLILLTACVSIAPPREATPATVTGATVPLQQSAVIALAPASASLVSGRLTAMAMGGGIHITGEVGGLQRNSAHGLHVHETGDCGAADASSAGPHFNPAARPHGRPDAGAHHAGDLPNVTAGPDGVARINIHVDGLTLGGAPATNVLGRALVLHAQPDDYASQPAGNSGSRIACGVISAGR